MPPIEKRRAVRINYLALSCDTDFIFGSIRPAALHVFFNAFV